MDQPDPARAERGPLDSIRTLGTTFLALVGARVELAVTEFREEGERRQEMLVVAVVAAVFLSLGALLLALFIVIIFWDEHRVAAAGAVTLAYLGIGAYMVMRLKRLVRESPPPFEATLAEFAKDAEAMRGGNE